MLRWTLALLSISCLVAGETRAADAPAPDLALSFRPVQKGVEIESPPKTEVAKCKVQVERKGKASGWVVLGPAGQVLRRFMDTNGDNVVDQWRYYLHGLEVYRDVDGDFNNKVDQSRWLNTAGTRWGLDSNEDGRIDRWKVLSAEEATREAILALAAGDENALKTVLINQDDVKELGLNASIARQLLEAVSDPGAKLKKTVSSSKLLSPKTAWQNFDSSGPPCVIPAEDGKADRDVVVYSNAMAIVETAGKPGFVQMGELIRVGDVWKLTQIPQPMEGTSVQLTYSSVLLQPTVEAANAAAGVGNLSPEAQKLLKELQDLDRAAPAPGGNQTALVKYNADRADLLDQLIKQSATDDEREQWMRQMADGLTSAIQTGAYPQGFARLQALETDARRKIPKSDVVSYIQYRRLLADYYQRLRAGTAEDREKIQTWWLGELEEFVKQHGDAEDAPEALWQLAVALEFSGETTDARKWYSRLTAGHAETNSGIRAAGALRRLDLKDKPLELTGPTLQGRTINTASYRGKVLLVIFWTTWCKPCTEDLPQILELYKQYGGQGFEIVGVNLDTTTDPIAGYLRQHKVTWPQIHQPGGLTESPPAQQFGIISLPTMILVNKQGNVVHRSASVETLKKQLPELLK